MDKYKVIISDNATKMLVSHIRFLAGVSISAAEKLRTDVISAAKTLQEMPERNPWLSDNVIPANKYRKMIVAKHYLLIYQMKKNMIYIDFIVDCRQDYMWLLK